MGIYYPQGAMTLKILWEDGKLTSDPALQRTYSLSVLAKSLTVTINDYSTADTFECEIDYKNFPFDPRAIRACGVTVHLQNTKQLENGIDPNKFNTVFVGFADDDSISFDDSKRTVRLSGRDYTSLLIDKPYASGSIAMTNRLDILMQTILDTLKETKPIKLDVRGVTKESLPVLSTFDQSHQLSGHKNVDRHENYWEVIQDLAGRSGMIAFIELDKLVLTKPRALYDAGNAKAFIYGYNIKNLTFKRKIGRKKNFNVIVRSMDDKTVIDAKIPAEATAAWSKATGISIGEVKIPEVGPQGETVDKEKWKPAPYLSFRVPNCKTKEHLIDVAQGIYEECSRQQIEGSFETKEMETATIKGDIFNILQLRNGTPIQITIEQDDLAGIQAKPASERAQYLILRGYEPAIAHAFAKSLGQFVNVYYTKQVKFTLDNESGFKAQVDFLNFIDLEKTSVK